MGGTVRDATLELLRAHGMTTVFGNPGSTELGFLGGGWPADLRYVLALQEASAVAMADGYAQASDGATFVNLHSAAGLGHALGSLFTAYRNRAPLVVTAGQQVRALLPHHPYLFAEDAALFPRPYVKWSCEPARAEDVPLALARAYHTAMQAPRGPCFVSIPADDWSAPAEPVARRRVAGDPAPDPAALDAAADALAAAARPVLVTGPGVDRAGPRAWEAVVRLAERTGAPAWAAPVSNRAGFPEDHPQFAGFLPASPEALSERLRGHDLILVLGAPAFTFHVAGDADVLRPGGPRLVLLTDDPAEAARAPAGDAVVGDLRAAVVSLDAALTRRLPQARPPRRGRPWPPAAPPPADPMAPDYVLHALARAMPEDAVLVEEAPSHRRAMQAHLPIRRPGGFHTMASGGLGWALPAAFGHALARPERRVVCLIGDGSVMYSIQALWTGARHGLPVTVVVLDNGGYGAMRAFSRMLQAPDPPGCELGGLDFVGLATAQGVPARRAARAADLPDALAWGLAQPGPALLEVPVADPVERLY